MKLPQVQSRSFVPDGGLDLVTPVLLLRDGAAFDASNWECDTVGGVSRIAGYDRYVGGRTPAESDFRIATVSCHSGSISTDQVLRGELSNATMRFAAKYTASTEPRIVAGESNVAIYVTDVHGVFIAGEVLVEADPYAPSSLSLDMPPDPLSTDDAEEVETARVAAEAALRPLMSKPGVTELLDESGERISPYATGSTLGVFVLNDITYVVKQQSREQLEYGVTDNVLFLKPRVNVDQGGTTNREWDIAVDAEDIYGPGSHFEFVLSNLHAPSGPPAVYGVSGTSKAFQFNGTTLTYITTGMTDDRPNHIAVHANRIFLAFGGSLQYSPINTPFGPWVLHLGANELAMGAEITGLLSVTGAAEQTALLISTKDKLLVLYGKSDLTFQLVPFSENTGALPNTMQWMTQPLFQSAYGLTAMSATARFGGFNAATISAAIKPFMDVHRGRATASMICRDKNQYRIFFDDGRAVYTTFREGKLAGSFTVKYRHKVTCSWSCVLSDDTELMLIGTEDGGLYKLDVGSSFAGESIAHHIRFAFNHMGTPRTDKHFKRSVVEIQADRYVSVQLGYDLDYGDRSRDVTEEALVASTEGGVLWDDGYWDDGYWDAADRTPVTIDTPGTGNNISIRVRGDDRLTSPFTISAVIIDYLSRRQRR